jgi:hypothetical protein
MIEGKKRFFPIDGKMRARIAKEMPSPRVIKLFPERRSRCDTGD